MKSKLLVLLQEDVDVRNEIESICRSFSSNQIEESQNLNNELKDELNQGKKIIQSNQRKILDLEKQIKNLQETNSELLSQNKTLEKLLQEKEVLFNLYQELPRDITNSLSQLISSDSEESILVSLTQLTNLEMFWDYVKDQIVNESYPEIHKTLIDMFDYSFSIFMKADTRYMFQTIEYDEFFDTDTMIRDNKGKSDGNVANILLRGFINKKTENIVRKSIVVLH